MGPCFDVLYKKYEISVTAYKYFLRS